MTIPTDGRIDLDALAELATELREWPGDGDDVRQRAADAMDSLIDLACRAAIPSEQGEAVARTEDGRIAPPLEFGYTNWRGEFSQRCVLPLAVRFGSTEWHPEPQWLLTAWDAEKAANRDFAMRDMVLAAHPAPAAGVKVKALEWRIEEMEPASSAVTWWVAVCPTTNLGYDVRITNHGKTRMRRIGQDWSDFAGSVDEAKAAAQADYEVRILSALDEGEPK